MPRAAAVYVRISQDRDGRGLGVDRQAEDCRKLVKAKGWKLAQVYRDNDISASSGRTRPAYRKLFEDIEAGQITAVAVWALDRLHRRPAELEQFIDLCDRHGVALASVGGDVDLGSPAGRLHARIMGSVARHEVEQKGARTRRAQLQAAQQGRWLGGGRPFGYQADGVTLDRAEAREIKRMCQSLLAGVSLGEMVRDLNARGVNSARGNPWSYATIRQVLRRPRNAGLAAYKGELFPGSWRPIVSEETWRGVSAVLDDPARRNSTSNARRWLLAGLARCGVCGGPVKSGNVISNRRTRAMRPLYRCHVARTAADVDDLVSGVVVARLSRPDAGDLLVDDDRPDSSALRDEAQLIRARLDSLAIDFADGTLTASQLRTATGRLRERLADVEKHQATVTRAPILADLIRSRDVQARWEALTLGRRRAVVDALMVVTILPSGRRGNVFNPNLVRMEWRS